MTLYVFTVIVHCKQSYSIPQTHLVRVIYCCHQNVGIMLSVLLRYCCDCLS